MTIAARFDTVVLWDKEGKLHHRIRVPVDNGLPEVIMWGNRYFVPSLHGGNYREGRMYLVPLGDMRGEVTVADGTRGMERGK